MYHAWHEAKHCFLTHSRDMVYVAKRAYDPESNQYVVSSESVDHPNVPKDPKVVRSQVKASGWVLEPIDESHTKATYVTTIDVGGSLPRQILATVSSSAADGGALSSQGDKALETALFPQFRTALKTQLHLYHTIAYSISNSNALGNMFYFQRVT